MLRETVSELRVRYAETDQMGVVYHSNYLIWCEIGRTDFIRAAGQSYADLERDGVMLAVSEAGLRYHGAARYDDLIRVYTSLQELGSRGMTFSYRVVRAHESGNESGNESGAEAGNETVLVRASTSLVCTNTEGRPTRLPRDVRDWLEEARKCS